MSSCGHCEPRAVAYLAAWGSLRAMRVHTMITALSVLLTACSSVVIFDDSTSGGGAVGETGEGESSEGGSTGLGGSETGAPGSTGAAESSNGSTGTTEGEASTTTGEGSSTGSGSSTGELGTSTDTAAECGLVFFYPNDIPRCECDGMPVDPVQCGCSFTEAGCECDGVLHEEMTCGWPCQPAGSPDLCTCGNFPADVEFCEL